jgi:hypothetical protein
LYLPIDVPGVTQTYTITSDSIVYVVQTVYLPDTTLVETSTEATESSLPSGLTAQGSTPDTSAYMPPTTSAPAASMTSRRSSTSLLPTASGVSETSLPVSSGGSSK